MTNPNGALPTFILFPDASGAWHLAHANGMPLFEGQHLSYETLLSLAKETGAAYKIIDPKKHQTKGTT